MREDAIRVAVNGYGAIGKRVVDAVRLQPDMVLAGVADVATDWRPRILEQGGVPLFGADAAHVSAMEAAGLRVTGTFDELLTRSDVVVDCTPKGRGAENARLYRDIGVKFVVQGGEAHEVAGHSFVAEVNFAEAVGRTGTRVVSCNTTSIVRTLGALAGNGLVERARGTLMRRATDPWESHMGGIMNTVVPEADIPSHQALDAQTVLPNLDVVTMAVRVPQTLAHVHMWSVDLTRPASLEEVLAAFGDSPRIARARMSDGLTAINTVKEVASDMGRPRGDLYEVVLWEEMLTVRGTELFYGYMVDNLAIVIPETIDAVRALGGWVTDAGTSIRMTNESLGIRGGVWPPV